MRTCSMQKPLSSLSMFTLSPCSRGHHVHLVTMFTSSPPQLITSSHDLITSSPGPHSGLVQRLMVTTSQTSSHPGSGTFQPRLFAGNGQSNCAGCDLHMGNLQGGGLRGGCCRSSRVVWWERCWGWVGYTRGERYDVLCCALLCVVLYVCCTVCVLYCMCVVCMCVV